MNDIFTSQGLALSLAAVSIFLFESCSNEIFKRGGEEFGFNSDNDFGLGLSTADEGGRTRP